MQEIYHFDALYCSRAGRCPGRCEERNADLCTPTPLVVGGGVGLRAVLLWSPLFPGITLAGRHEKWASAGRTLRGYVRTTLAHHTVL
jgi:hypothetical protein